MNWKVHCVFVGSAILGIYQQMMLYSETHIKSTVAYNENNLKTAKIMFVLHVTDTHMYNMYGYQNIAAKLKQNGKLAWK